MTYVTQQTVASPEAALNSEAAASDEGIFRPRRPVRQDYPLDASVGLRALPLPPSHRQASVRSVPLGLSLLASEAEPQASSLSRFRTACSAHFLFLQGFQN